MWQNIKKWYKTIYQTIYKDYVQDMDGCQFYTAIFTLVVSSAVLLHDVSARAGDVSMGLTSFPLAEFCCCRSKNRGMVRLYQNSTNLEPVRKKVISLNHVKLRATRKQQNRLQLTTIRKIAVCYWALSSQFSKAACVSSSLLFSNLEPLGF